MTDADLLNGLQNIGNGPWICRPSSTGRGLRIHEISYVEAAEEFGIVPDPSIRGAIAAFLEWHGKQPSGTGR